MNKQNKIKFISGILVANISLISLSSCSKNVDCNVKEEHAHLYTSDDGKLDKYIISEKESKNGLKRNDTYIEIDDKVEKLINFENTHGLYRISINNKKIKEIENNCKNFTEYEYKHRYCTYVHTGKTTIPVWHTSYNYTADKNHSNLTGNTRLAHHMFRGYKIEKNEKGKYVVIKSKLYDKIDDIPKEYIYVKNDVFELVYKEINKEKTTYKDEEENDYKKNSDEKSEESYKKTRR